MNHYEVLDQVIKDVSNGQFLSSSLAKFKNNFDDFAINMIRVGEESGTLNENLNYLADELKKKQALRSKVTSAFVYPVFLLIATFGIAGFLTIYIFPKILPIFSSLNVHLPITTRILIWFSKFLQHYGPYLGLVFVGLIVAIIFLMRKEKFRFKLQQIIFKIPPFGTIIQNYYLANLCRTLSILLRGDIRIIKAFEIAAETTSSLVYKRELATISRDINKGGKITAHMVKHRDLFPDILTHMLDIGEATGKFDETLAYLSEMYEAEVEETTKNLSTVLEPILMIFMGIVVGFVAISIISPIYQITQNLTPR